MTVKSTKLKKIGAALDSGDEKGVIIAVAIALIIVIGVVAGYYIYHVICEKPEGFTSIYVLDSQGKAINYTFTLGVNQNTTFHVYVVNHMGATESCQILEKITNESIQQLPIDATPTNTYTKTLANDEQLTIPAPVILTAPGSYSIIFELWLNNAGTLHYTGNAVILNVDAVVQP